MTASLTSERPGKRDRLVAGPGEAMYRQGFEATTIAATRDPAVWSQSGASLLSKGLWTVRSCDDDT